MACTQATATSAEPAYRPADPVSTASDVGARVAPPTRPPASSVRVEEAGAEVDSVDGAVAAAGVGSPSRVSRTTSSRPSPDRSTAAPTMSHGSALLFRGGGAPYPAGPAGGP